MGNKSTNLRKRVIFFSEPYNMSSSILLEYIAEDDNIEVVAIAASTRKVSDRNTAKGFLKIIRTSGFSYFLMRVREAMHFRLMYGLAKAGLGLYSMRSFRFVARIYDIKTYLTGDVNDEKFLEIMRQKKPDLIVSCIFNQLLKKELLNIPKYGCINIHRSMLPKDRGLSATFNVLARNEESTGVTIHKVEEGLDTGPIYHQEKILIDNDTVFSLSQKMMHSIKEPLVEVIKNIESLEPVPQGSDYTQSSHPDKVMVRMFREYDRRLA